MSLTAIVIDGRRVTFPLFHPIANLFPLIEGAEFDALVADVEANGLLDEIVMLEGMVLDGRNRLRAARRTRRYGPAFGADSIDGEAGGEGVLGTWRNSWHFVEFGARDFDEAIAQRGPLSWVLSKNLRRRHLSDSQRAMIAAEISTLEVGRPAKPDGNSSSLSSFAVSQGDAAALMDVSRSSVQTAERVRERGVPELADAVKQGGVSVSAAAELASLPVTEQLEILRSADPRAISRIAKERRAEQQAEKRERRDERAAELGARHQALPVVKAGIILCDPAWQDDEVWSAETGMDRAADNHYPTMTLAEVMDLDVGSLAAADAILFMWCKTNNLIDAFCVAMAWGFAALGHDEAGRIVPEKARCRYVSEIAWDKVVIGNGRWVRDRHEHLLIFRRGNPVAPAPGTQLASVLSERKTHHSAKPESVLDWIDRVWPDEVKVELNRRGAARPGWLAWGNEALPNSPEIPDGSISNSTPPAMRGVDTAGEDGSAAPSSPRETSPADTIDESQAAVAGETGEVTAAAISPVTALTFAEARPILEARYATEDGQTLADELGIPLGTLRGWAFRAGLTSKARASANGRAHAGQLMRDKTSIPEVADAQS